jgi:hypothetical protein
MLPELGKSIALRKVPRFRPFILLVRAICRWRCAWSIGGKIMTGENNLLGGKRVLVPLCSPQISHGLTWDRTLASAVRGRRLTAWSIAQPSRVRLAWIIYTDSARTAQYTHYMSVTKVSHLKLRKTIIAVCYETNTKHTHTDCASRMQDFFNVKLGRTHSNH